MDLSEILILEQIQASNPDRFFYTDNNYLYKLDQNIDRGKNEYLMQTQVQDCSFFPKLYASTVIADLHIIKMEFCEGCTLEAIKKISHLEYTCICNQLYESCNFLYQNKIIHGDINESNLIYNPKNKKIKIIDFEFARAVSSDEESILIENMRIYKDEFYKSEKNPWGIEHVLNFARGKICD